MFNKVNDFLAAAFNEMNCGGCAFRRFFSSYLRSVTDAFARDDHRMFRSFVNLLRRACDR
jgi:hypothetical protein